MNTLSHSKNLIKLKTTLSLGALLLLLSCGGAGNSGSGGAILPTPTHYSYALWSAGFGFGKVLMVTSDGRFCSGEDPAGPGVEITDPNGGHLNELNQTGAPYAHSNDISANRNGNLVLGLKDSNIQTNYYALFANSIQSGVTTWTNLIPTNYSTDSTVPVRPISINLRKEVLILQTNADSTYSVLYEDSPGSPNLRPIYTSPLQPTATLDDNGGIMIFSDHAIFMTSASATPFDLKGGNGMPIKDKVDLVSSGQILVHSTPPAYFDAGDYTHAKLVAQANAKSVAVSFLNSKGVAGGSYIDSSGTKRPCIWHSLSESPMDLSNVVAATTLFNVDYVFDSGVAVVSGPGDISNTIQVLITPQP